MTTPGTYVRRWCAVGLVASCGGFSTVETSAVIGAVSMLSATAAPHMKEYIELAHGTKALGDARVIAITVFRLMVDVGQIGGHQRVKPTLLVGDGKVPESDGPATSPWLAPVDEKATQSLAAHLVDNAAGYPVADASGRRWRGPYLEGLSADPWGSRYAVNVGAFQGRYGEVVIVVSPGPNAIIETPFSMVGLKTGGDDVIGLVGTAR